MTAETSPDATETAQKPCPWRRTGRSVGKACVFTLHATGFLAAAISTMAIILFAVLGADGVSLEAFRPAVEKQLARAANAESVSIGALHLERDQRGDAPFRLTARDVHLNQGEAGALSVPELSLRIGPGTFMRGLAIPRHIDVTGATLDIVRQGDAISIGGTDGRGAPFSVTEVMNRARQAGFEGARFRELALNYRNVETGAALAVSGAVAALDTDGQHYSFVLDVPNGRRSQPMLTLSLDADAGTGSVTAELVARDAPADTILPLIVGRDDSVRIDAPVSGVLSATGTDKGGLQRIDFDLAIGEGTADVRGQRMPVRAVNAIGALDPETLHVDVTELAYDVGENQGWLRGGINLVRQDDQLGALVFDLEAQDLIADPGGLLGEPLPVPSATLVGRYDFKSRTVVFDAIDADYFGARLRGALAVALPRDQGDTAGMTADLSVYGTLTPAQVMRGWPPAMARDTRDWIVQNLPIATLYNVHYTMDLPRGALSGGATPRNDYLDLTFDAKDATIHYMPGMRPITDLVAKGRVQGNAFSLDASSGRGPEGVTLTKGSIRIDRFAPTTAPARFEISVAGPVRGMLSILDEPPLGYISAAQLTPSDFTGKGTFDLTLSLPLRGDLKPEEVSYAGQGTFEGVTFLLDAIDKPVTSARGRVTLGPEGLGIEGRGRIEDVPADFAWRHALDERGTMDLTASANLTSRAADAVGLPLRRFVRGVVPTRITAQGFGGRLREMSIAADLTPAALTGDDRQFLKQAGTEGQMTAQLALGAPGEPLDFEHLTLSMPGVNVEGNARFTPEGGLLRLELPRLFVENLADISLRLVREGDGIKVSLEGDRLVIASMIDDWLQRGGGAAAGSALPGTVTIDAALGRLDLKSGVSLTDFAMRGVHSGERMEVLSASGQFARGGDVFVELTENENGIGKDIVLSTDQFGRVLEGLFGIGSVTGGAARIEATAIEDGPLAGSFAAKDVVIRDAPLVAKLLSVGSLDGLAAVLNGEGLLFDDLIGDVQLEAGIMRLVDARLTGSALGISANGNVDLSGSSFGLRGAVAPAYALNSFFGGVPGLGELFVSREGEGLFAFSYKVDGPIAEPTVTVNTLSALTPGIFRRLFEDPAGDEVPTTAELLSAAEAAARADQAAAPRETGSEQ